MPKRKYNIFIMRLSAMGDVAMVVPVIKAFRERYPDVTVTVFTRPFFQPFFRDVENVRFLAPDFNGRHKGFFGTFRLWRDVMSCGVTHVADFHDVIRTKMIRNLLRVSGRRVAVINKGRGEKKELTRRFHKNKRQLKTSIQRYTDTLRRLGFRFPDPVPAVRRDYPIPDDILSVAGPRKGVWIGVAPFAQHQGKIYPPSHSEELIRLLSQQYDRIFVFGGGELEKQFADRMEESYDGVISVIGRIRLNDELNLMSNLDLMVTMDSSAMHMASLMGVTAVSVWGATHPYAGFYGFGQDPKNAVQIELPCRPCSIYGNKPCMYGDYRCMERITPQRIIAKVNSAIGGTNERKRTCADTSGMPSDGVNPVAAAFSGKRPEL